METRRVNLIGRVKAASAEGAERAEETPVERRCCFLPRRNCERPSARAPAVRPRVAATFAEDPKAERRRRRPPFGDAKLRRQRAAEGAPPKPRPGGALPAKRKAGSSSSHPNNNSSQTSQGAPRSLSLRRRLRRPCLLLR